MNKHTFRNVPRNAKMEGEGNNNSVAALNWTIISQAVIDTTEEEFAALDRFSLNVADDFRTEGSSVEVEVIDGVGEAQKNLKSWSLSDLKTSKVSVEMDRYSRPVSLTYADRKNGVTLVNKVQSMVRAVARAFWNDVIAAIAASGAEVVNVGPRKTFTPEIVTEEIWPSMTNGADALFLDRLYYSKLIPTNALGLDLASGAYSIPGGVHFVEGVNVLANNTGVGFASRHDGAAVALRLPEIPPDLGIRTEVVTSPKLGISILIKYWGNKDTETISMSAELLAGVKVCNKNHLRQLSSAPIVEEGGAPAVVSLEGASIPAPAGDASKAAKAAPKTAKTAKTAKSGAAVSDAKGTPAASGEPAAAEGGKGTPAESGKPAAAEDGKGSAAEGGES